MVASSKERLRMMNLLITKENTLQWQYRTILFEFQKDGLLGDTFIDDEEIEKTLNEQGARGWELVNVTLIQEGLMAFCKRQVSQSISKTTRVNEPVNMVSSNPSLSHRDVTSAIPVGGLKEKQNHKIHELKINRQEKASAIDNDAIGSIKIS